ncbi:MAG: Fur family transcriptional regulator ferric uptake regulator [Chloroflexi bacterium]|nr:MAG: Fur family transcriptional regulator ferric uptake regulator [Chloroflexota bacterium]
MRNSSADQIILDTLAGQSSHLTSHQIYEVVHERLPAINPSTIYRSLERLAKNGKISISDLGSGAAVYEMSGDEQHHHLVCQNCGHIVQVPDEQISPLISQLEDKYHYKVTTNHLVLFGVCEICQQTEAE